MPKNHIQINKKDDHIIVRALQLDIPAKEMTDADGNIKYATTIIDRDCPEISVEGHLCCDAESIVPLMRSKIVSHFRGDVRHLDIAFKITPGNLEVCEHQVFVKGVSSKSPYYLRAVLTAPKKFIQKNMPKHCKGSKHPFGKTKPKTRTHYVGQNPFPLQGGKVSPK